MKLLILGEERIKMISFTIETKKIQVWPSKDANRPVIYFNTFSEEGEQVLSLLKDNSDMTEKNHDFTLAAISNLDWDHDMSPWDIPPIFKGDTPCTGGANDYLNLLTKKILPETENHIKGSAAWRGLAGYSLAGLLSMLCIKRRHLPESQACLALCGSRESLNISIPMSSNKHQTVSIYLLAIKKPKHGILI